ncbi:heme A synthase [filamentous cyanobacterium LEGE 11480]|uniref:Heme A synthase n=1 Tax=Romeriopsis navalis LEGE 11480 TaxID=2777977 RepID=A0A928Z1Y3_9CYAN|nr:COX15/CtaA family protein [Romeriopsis navalis]MBE9028969.1 heme A synthase [Romeriopsis navalis LEGE 11480]
MSDATFAPGTFSWPMRRRLAWFSLGLALCTMALMALGSSTRVMNAGLSCPDWPLCYGEFLPQNQMNLQVFLEWFHRLVASVIGFGTIVLAGTAVSYRARLPKWTPWATGFALFLVVFQGVLGGLTVTELLRFDIVTAHLGTGLAFFSTLLTVGLLLLDYRPRFATGRLRWVALAAAIGIYAQSLLGGLVASQWAVHQCFGLTQLCAVLNSHLIGVVPATIGTLLVLGWLVRLRYQSRLDPRLQQCGWFVALFLTAQISLGFATFRLRLQVEPLTVAHQTIGAALLGSLIMTTVWAFLSSVQDVETVSPVDLTEVHITPPVAASTKA